MRNKQNKIAHITTITFSLYFPGSNSPLYSHLIYSCNMVGWEEENEDYGLYMSVCFFSSSSYFSFKPAWIVNGVPCPPLSPKYRISSTSCSDLGVPSAACLLGLAFYFFFFPFSPLHVHNCCHLFNISSHRWHQLGCWVLPWVCWKCLSSVYSIGKPLVSSHSTQCHGLYKATYTHHSFTLCVSPLPLEAHGSAGLNWYFVREFLLCEVCVFLQGTVTEVKSPHLEKRVAGKGKDLNVKIIYFCSHKSSQVSVLVL